jgi:hypothetical protein
MPPQPWWRRGYPRGGGSSNRNVLLVRPAAARLLQPVAVLAVEQADSVPWFVIAGVALGAWLVLFAIIASVTMPRLPDARPETTELGPESPAVANFLVSRCKLTTSALSGTLVDLAARRRVTIEQINDDENLVRIRRQGPDTANAYETQMLSLVRDRATNDCVPATELSLGYGQEAESWSKRFEDAVTDHARQLGLIRRRFSPAQSILLAATLAVPFALGGVGWEIYEEAGRAANADSELGGRMLTAAGIWMVVLAVGAAKLRGWRETAAGSAAMARWLGVRNFLRHDESFVETPPAGVAIWDRLLAYGIALGVAHGADAALPIGPTRDDEGWSPRRGLWRQVRIKYPKRFAYGETPVRAALFSALILLAVGLLGLWLAPDLVPAVIDGVRDIANDKGNERWAFAGLLAVLAAPLAFVGVQLVRRTIVLVRALSDLGHSESFEGYVVRVPWHYVSDGDGGSWTPRGYTAVDDGSSDEIRALRYYSPDVREGQTVRVTLTPRLRHVVRIESMRP